MWFQSLWDWGTKLRFLHIIIDCQTTINMFFSKHSCPMLQGHSINNSIFRGANFGAYTDPSFPPKRGDNNHAIFREVTISVYHWRDR